MNVPEIDPVSLEELEKKHFIISEKVTRTWDFLKDGEQVKGSADDIFLFYKQANSRLLLAIKDIKSTKGIVKNTQYNQLSMALTVVQALNDKIQKFLHKPLIEMLFERRMELFPKLVHQQRIQRVEDMERVFDGIIVTGVNRVDPSKTFSMLCPEVPKTKDLSLDEELCEVITPNGAPYNWTQLNDRTYTEIILELVKIREKNGRIIIEALLRMVVCGGIQHPRLSRRRYMEQDTPIVGEKRSVPEPMSVAPLAEQQQQPVAEPVKEEKPAKRQKPSV